MVPAGRDSVNLKPAAVDALKARGYIVGQLPRTIFYEPGVKETDWSVTDTVVGADGQRRRWVYLHYFKEGQPTFNWLDSTFAAARLVAGDAITHWPPWASACCASCLTTSPRSRAGRRGRGTARVRVGTNVLNNDLRNPVLVMHEARRTSDPSGQTTARVLTGPATVACGCARPRPRRSGQPSPNVSR